CGRRASARGRRSAVPPPPRGGAGSRRQGHAGARRGAAGRNRPLVALRRRRAQMSQRKSAVANDRKRVKTRTSGNAVSNGPAVIAGSNPRLLDSMGIIVPAKPERFTEMNIEGATTHEKAAGGQTH